MNRHSAVSKPDFQSQLTMSKAFENLVFFLNPIPLGKDTFYCRDSISREKAQGGIGLKNVNLLTHFLY